MLKIVEFSMETASSYYWPFLTQSKGHQVKYRWWMAKNHKFFNVCTVYFERKQNRTTNNSKNCLHTLMPVVFTTGCEPLMKSYKRHFLFVPFERQPFSILRMRQIWEIIWWSTSRVGHECQYGLSVPFLEKCKWDTPPSISNQQHYMQYHKLK